MTGKFHIWIALLLVAGQECYTAENVPVPGSAVIAVAPAGWSEQRNPGGQLLFIGPGHDQTRIPRLALSACAAEPEAAATGLRDGLLRVTDGCEIIDDDRVPIGGRVWHRIRLRFAAGPLAFGQSAWTGTVGGTTLVVVLSAPDDELAGHLPVAIAMIAALSLAQ